MCFCHSWLSRVNQFHQVMTFYEYCYLIRKSTMSYPVMIESVEHIPLLLTSSWLWVAFSLPTSSYQLIGAWWCHMASVILVNIGSGKGLSPIRQQSITRTNTDLLLVWPWITQLRQKNAVITYLQYICRGVIYFVCWKSSLPNKFIWIRVPFTRICLSLKHFTAQNDWAISIHNLKIFRVYRNP